MTNDEMKVLANDSDGLMTYEYLANNIGLCDDDMGFLADNMIKVDTSGQFLASAARYLSAIDGVKYAPIVDKLLDAVIEKDREHKYLGDLISAIWGADYAERVDELNASDNNFRRIYKRLYPSGRI